MQLHGNPIKRQPLNRALAIAVDLAGSTATLVRSLFFFFFANVPALDKSKVSPEYAYTFDPDPMFYGGLLLAKNRVHSIMSGGKGFDADRSFFLRSNYLR